ncbi:MAG: helix-turn-helix domain-containing protein, partial [Pseudonocardiaceae bacterium]
MVASSPTLLKRWIAAELRRLREAAGWTRQQAAQRLDKTLQQIGHIETVRNLPSTGDLEALLTSYGAADRIELFRSIARQARKGKDWWIGFEDAMPRDFDLYLGLEASAMQIHSYAAVVVPGLLQ